MKKTDHSKVTPINGGRVQVVGSLPPGVDPGMAALHQRCLDLEQEVDAVKRAYNVVSLANADLRQKMYNLSIMFGLLVKSMPNEEGFVSQREAAEGLVGFVLEENLDPERGGWVYKVVAKQ